MRLERQSRCATAGTNCLDNFRAAFQQGVGNGCLNSLMSGCSISLDPRADEFFSVLHQRP
jgi:hypothetical protein